MTSLILSFALFVAVMCGVFLFRQEYLMAVAWLCFAAANAVVLRKLFMAPTYFEKVIMDYLGRVEGSAERGELLSHFRAETPNLKSRQVEVVFSRTLSSLQRRGLIKVAEDLIEKTPN